MTFNIEYRPNCFDDVVGNRDIILSLQNSLSNIKSFPHLVLLTGSAGCGKTTLARIIANALKCSDMDRVEMNMSDNRGIDSAREIISQMNYLPLQGNTKVWILDEVHKTTNEFQNAMLKAFEEPPEHVYFILCTTDPEKLIKTIKSRACSYQVQKLNIKALSRIMKRILEKENIEVDEKYIDLIARESDGAPREALMKLQQIVGIQDEEAIMKIIKSSEKEKKQIIDLCRALYEGKTWAVIMNIIKDIEAEPETIRRSVLGYFNSIVVNQKDKKSALRYIAIIECFSDNYYDNGKSGLFLSCFHSIMEKN